MGVARASDGGEHARPVRAIAADGRPLVARSAVFSSIGVGCARRRGCVAVRELVVLRRARSRCVARGDTLRRDHHRVLLRTRSVVWSLQAARSGWACSYRMWTGVGFRGRHAPRAAVAATTVISLATLFVLPVVTLAVHAHWRADPEEPWCGSRSAAPAVFVVLFGIGVVLLLNEPAVAVGRSTWSKRAARRLHRDSDSDPSIEQERDRLPRGARRPAGGGRSRHRSGFGPSTICRSSPCWWRSTRTPSRVSSCSRSPLRRSSRMVPLTPGRPGDRRGRASPGCSRSPASPPPQALLATLAYRIVSYWLSLPAGLVAWWMFRRRFPAVGQAVR